MQHGSLLAQPRQLLSLSEQLVVDDQSGSHMHKCAICMHMFQCQAGEVTVDLHASDEVHQWHIYAVRYLLKETQGRIAFPRQHSLD
jgi:hypothetical protein